MNKEQLIQVFVDTQKQVNTKKINCNSVTTKYNFSNYRTGVVNTPDTFISNIYTINLDSVSAVVEYSKDGNKVCVLNMASAKRGGGGVRNGSKAQEECLFRSSNLFDTIVQEYYPLKDDECLYTKDAVFFKDRFYNNMTPVTSDVVTVAAINLNNGFGSAVLKPSNYFELTKQKIRLIVLTAIENNVDTLILGSWGCGVFKNDPYEMSKMFYDVLVNEFYSNKFKTVVFAIINDHNSVDDNFNVFSKIF